MPSDTKKKPKAKKPQSQKVGGVQHDLAHWFDLAGPELIATAKGVLTPPGHGPTMAQDWAAVDPAPTSSHKSAPGKSKASKPTAAELQEEEEAAIQANPFTQMGEDLAYQQAQESAAALSYLGPQQQASASAGAQAQALQDAGGGAGAASWLAGNVAQANANDSPMTQAMAAYEAAYNATEPSVLSADMQMGQANALAEQVAPADAYLQLAGSGLGSSTYKQLSAAQAANLPPALAYYLGPGGAQVGGVTGQSASIPSTGAILSGATAAGTTPTNPAALSAGTGTAPG